MKLSLEDREKQYRAIYEAINENPRIKIKKLIPILNTNHVTARRRLNEALDQGYVLAPQMRKRSFSNMKEYVYLINCPYPFGR